MRAAAPAGAAAPAEVAPAALDAVHRLISRWVRTTPDAVAVRVPAVPGSAAVELTYAVLDVRANRLAHHLVAVGVTPEDVVAVLLPPSADLVVVLIAIWKAGAAYLALDRRHPAERLRTVVRDAGCRVLVTAGEPDVDLPITEQVRLDTDGAGIDARPDDEVPAQAGPGSAAYVAYTSGSTGRPKGVVVPHRAVRRLVAGPAYAPLGPGDAVLQFAPVAFDASTFELWAPLANGARLVVAPDPDLAVEGLLQLVHDERVSVLWLTAGLFHRVVDDGPLEALRHVRVLLAGGDVLSVPHVERFRSRLPHVRLVNGYGPTENTTFTTCHPVDDAPGGPSVPIGRPLPGDRAHVLGERLEPVADGVEGELHAAGAGLAHGYLGRPALTAERFVADPFGPPGTRMYRTGDVVRRRPDGVLEFVGRRDRQVKIRGVRVEPGEVEATLRRQPDVAQCAVVVAPDGSGERRLVAFVTAHPTRRVSVLSVRRALGELLPAAAVPGLIIPVEELPLTVNGKVDSSALLGMVATDRPAVSAPHRPASTALEQELVALWRDLLRLDDVGVDDDFFELGGHSLLGMRLTTELSRVYGVTIGPRTFYADPTVAGLARAVADAAAHPR